MDFPREIRELLEASTEAGYATRLQDVCELFWASLETSNTDDKVLDCFIQLLRYKDNFELARLVIPEFRSADLTSQTGAKAHVLNTIADLRRASLQREGTTQANYDDECYREEKDIYLDAQVQRARLFIHDSAPSYPGRMEEIRQWLAACPSRDHDHSS